MDKRVLSFGILVAVASLLHSTNAETYYVGDSLGWLIPPGGSVAYATWAAMRTFTVGDVLVFSFATGQQDVARVTKEAFLTCNSTNPISLKTTGPANFTLDITGMYYFICTLDQHCPSGQRIAINVSLPRGPVIYTVGDEMGWIVPPAGYIAYKTWAYGRIFLVGDTLVFNFINETQDVALVTKDAYKNCNTSSPISVWTVSPVKLTLNTTGEYFFTSTYPHHCAFGQQLAINVTATSTAAYPPSSIAMPPSNGSPSAGVPTAGGPRLAPASSSSSRLTISTGFFITLMLSIAMVLF